MRMLYPLISLFFLSSAFATEDSVVNDPFKSIPKAAPRINPISPVESFVRTQAVLNYFGVPAEASNADLADVFSNQQSAGELGRILRILDPRGQFARFTKIENDTLSVFLDRDGRTQEDAVIALAPSAAPAVTDAIQNLVRARQNPADRPLLGLTIAIDPGHMSTREWDRYTGKFVRDRAGNYVSEGLIALQTALLLKQDFEALGAVVKLTRTDHEAVTDVPLRSLDIQAFGREALREQSLQAWFLALVSQNPVGPRLYNAFSNSLQFKALFKESARYNYFVLREDLAARVRAFEEIRPDISFSIHYDSQDPPRDPNGVNSRSYSRVKTYVHGSLSPEEWATNTDRRAYLRHALDTASWDASFNLATKVVGSLSRTLKLGYDQGGGETSAQVAPGVFSRNLYLTKLAHGHAHTYIECLHYNDPTEFRAMLRRDHTLVINGETTYYSSRVRQVADAIRDGVVSFVTARN